MKTFQVTVYPDLDMGMFVTPVRPFSKIVPRVLAVIRGSSVKPFKCASPASVMFGFSMWSVRSRRSRPMWISSSSEALGITTDTALPK